MKAAIKTNNLQTRLNRAGIGASFDQAHTLRRAELALQRWAKLECGDSNDYWSRVLVRDEETGKPFMQTQRHDSPKVHNTPIADKEKGALKRIAAVCSALNINYFHQTDPRGCALYVAKEPLTDRNYSHGVACCE
jgi:hypothetical protein